MENRIDAYLKKRSEAGLMRRLYDINLKEGSKLEYEGKEYINFSSNDYLGLSSHKEMIDAAIEGAGSIFGTTSSRLMTGSLTCHNDLEKMTASFKGKVSALVFNSGYQANVGVISALAGRKDVIFSDKLNHASIVDGMQLSGAKIFRYKHNDVEHLEYLLSTERAHYDKALVITETVFSMDGDIAPLKDIVDLKNKYDALLYIDEAHATGVFGADGSGLAAEAGIVDDADIIMGTFSKGLGGFGAYVACTDLMRVYLINLCRSFIFSTSLPGSVINANIKALELVGKEPERRKQLKENYEYLRSKLLSQGFDVLGQTQIIPVCIGDNGRTISICNELRDKGIWVTPVRPPTVPTGTSRIRISVTSNHSMIEIDDFIEIFKVAANCG